MFKSLFKFFKRKRRKESNINEFMLGFLVTELDLPPPGERYGIHAGKDGRATSIGRGAKGGLEIIFERKIKADDVVDGKLLPAMFTQVKRRGGKRITGITVSIEGAEDLHKLLGKVLAIEQRRRARDSIMRRAWLMLQNSIVALERRPS